MDPIGASNTWHWEAVRQRLRDDRRQADAVGAGRRPLRRRHVHQRLGHGALRLPVPPQRQVERQAARFPRSGSRWRARREPARTPAASYGFMNWFLNTPRWRDDGAPGPLPLPSAPPRASPSAATARTSSTSIGKTIWSSSCAGSAGTWTGSSQGAGGVRLTSIASIGCRSIAIGETSLA